MSVTRPVRVLVPDPPAVCCVCDGPAPDSWFNNHKICQPCCVSYIERPVIDRSLGAQAEFIAWVDEQRSLRAAG